MLKKYISPFLSEEDRLERQIYNKKQENEFCENCGSEIESQICKYCGTKHFN